MIIPIRCFSCNTVLADKWNAYKTQLGKLRKTNEKFYMDGTQVPVTPEKKIMDDLGVKRACCRRIFLTHVDLMHKI